MNEQQTKEVIRVCGKNFEKSDIPPLWRSQDDEEDLEQKEKEEKEEEDRIPDKEEFGEED